MHLGDFKLFYFFVICVNEVKSALTKGNTFCGIAYNVTVNVVDVWGRCMAAEYKLGETGGNNHLLQNECQMHAIRTSGVVTAKDLIIEYLLYVQII